MTSSRSLLPEDWGRAYDERRGLFESYATRIEALVGELLKESGVDYAQLESRAKEVPSFVSKLARSPGKYSDPLEEMLDLAGVRIICYYLSDVAIVGDLIRREFAVDEENSWTRESRADVDRFGYSSDHYVISCAQTREDLPEWSAYGGVRAEIQVRTVLQHAWAAIDHKLAYKRESDVPVALLRQLSRVSALLEVGDEQFEAVRSASLGLDASYDARARAGELDIPIDASSLPAYVSESDVVSQLVQTAQAIGFTIGREPPSAGIGVLVQASGVAEFDTVASLDSFLHDAEAWAEHALRALWNSRPHGSGWSMPVAFLVATILWIGTDTDLEEIRIDTRSDDFFIEALAAARAARDG
jgi:putative GTP pyrophosphokinase